MSFSRRPTQISSASGWVAALALAVAISIGFLSSNSSNESLNGIRCLEIEDESQHFYESSELRLPSNAQIILSCDDHIGFFWEGEYYIVFDLPPEEAATYLETRLWNAEWQKGPLPQDIQNRTGLSKWEESPFNSSEIQYVVQGSSRFASGRLMVIDPRIGRVLYSSWRLD